MKTFLLLNTLLFLTILNAQAEMNWQHEGYPICSDIAEMEYYNTFDLFCNSHKEFDRVSFCAQLDCITSAGNIKRCDQAILERANFLGIDLSYESDTGWEMQKAYSRYECDRSMGF